MAAHRYWRAHSVETGLNANLELAEFHLLAGATRVDASATLTASSSPTTGAIGNLKDDVLTTRARWVGRESFRRLVLLWDFGGLPQAVTDIRLGAGLAVAEFPFVLHFEFSDDGVAWTRYAIFRNITWPGPSAKTVSEVRYFDGAAPDVTAYSSFDGVNGQTGIIDKRGRTWSVANATLSTAQKKSGNASLSLPGPNSFATIAFHPDIQPDSGDFTVEMWAYLTADPSHDAGTLCEHWNTYGYFLNYDRDTRLPKFGGTSTVTGTVAPTGITQLPLNEWFHAALVRSNNTLMAFVNGIVQYISPIEGSLNVVGSEGASIGYDNSYARFIRGYVDEFRFTKGRAQYTEAFDPNATFIKVDEIGTSVLVELPTAPTNLWTPNGAVKTLPLLRGRNDYLTGVLGKGVGRVRGVISEHAEPTDLPVARRVRLIRESDGLVIREMWSRAQNGAYDFQYVDELTVYTVLSYDHTHNFRAVVADNISLANGLVELMP